MDYNPAINPQINKIIMTKQDKLTFDPNIQISVLQLVLYTHTH